MTSREAILRDIRHNLGREALLAVSAPPPVRMIIPTVPVSARIERMLDRVRALAGKAIHVRTGAEAAEYVAGVTKGRTSIASNSAFLRETGITALSGVVSGITDAEQLRGLCATADFGITSADYALTDTGSLVMIASPSEARLISLLPPIHIAVVPVERLLSGLDEFYTLVPKPADRTSSTVFITGPSRTADIEQLLIRGVHGPGEIHVVVVG
jgi:L-lactate dehydrogenase complex protein LldG